MATEVRFRGGTAAQHAAFVGAPREVTVDTTNWKLRVHDGSTPGGHEIGTGSAIAAATPPGRLSLTSGVAITVSDVAGAASLYYVPTAGNNIPVFDGSSFVPRSVGSGLTLALDADSGHAGYHQSGRNLDAFVINDGGIVRLGTGPSWNAGAVAGSDILRGTGAGSTEIEFYQGVWVNKNSITIRFGAASGDTVVVPARRATFVGSIRTTANGQVDDTLTKRFVSNAFNQAPRKLLRADPTASWAYSTATLRQVRGSSDNKVEVLSCLGGAWLELEHRARVGTSSGAQSLLIAIGVDQTTTLGDVDVWSPSYATSSQFAHPTAKYSGFVGLGLHAYNMLEQGAGADTQTWYGNLSTSRMFGSVYQ